MQPRYPNRDELRALEDYVYEHDQTRHHREVMKWAGFYPAAVFDEYVSEEGNYRGKLMIVIWPERPEYHQVFTFDQRGQVQPVEKDPAMYDPEKRRVYRSRRVKTLKELQDLIADPTPLL
jgi:hypothetical protein